MLIEGIRTDSRGNRPSIRRSPLSLLNGRAKAMRLLSTARRFDAQGHQTTAQYLRNVANDVLANVSHATKLSSLQATGLTGTYWLSK